MNIDLTDVLAIARGEPQPRDPFDRLLLAQCKVDGLRMVTMDCG